MTIQKISDKLARCEAVLWTYSLNNKNLHPVKIRVTFNRKSKYYSAQSDGEKIFVSPTQWKAISGTNPRGANKVLSDAINDSLVEIKRAINQVSKNRTFTFDRFEDIYIKKVSTESFFTRFENYLTDLQNEGRISTVLTYRPALSALKAFRNDKDFAPAELTPSMLKSFERFILSRGARITTVSIYMRAVKVVYNLFADLDSELRIDYPFAIKQNDRNKYTIPNSEGHKGEALDVKTLTQFIGTATDPDTPQHEAKLYFIFSLYGNGMNMRDIAHLRMKNVKGDVVVYIREKTKRTRKNSSVEIVVPLNDELNKIIERFIAGRDMKPDDYIFPILNHGMNPISADRAIRQAIQTTNKHLKKISEDNKLPEFTTYSARHSYASLLKAAKVSVEVIRELLGHSDIQVTENYLKRFSHEVKQEANANLDRVLKKLA